MRVSNRCSLRCLLATLALAACGDGLPADPDPGSPDGSAPDAAPPDASAGECAGRADGTACGDASDGECDAPDTCQGGVCATNFVADGTPCGDPTDIECDAADACARGSCSANLAADGAACYDCAGGPGQCATCSSAANNNHGFMFDVQATSPVVITSFDIHPLAAMTVRIYARTGTHVGFESDADGWALVGSAAGVAADGDAAVPVPIAVNWTIAAGTTAAFYVTSTGGASVSYHIGTSRATVAASDGNVVLFEGTGKSYPFDGSFIPRVFEGGIHYTLLPEIEVLDSSTGTATGPDVDGAMFDVVAAIAVEQADTLSVELDAGTFDVDTGAGEAGLRTDPGGAVGDPAVATADQTMLVGRALGGGFGAAGAPTVFRGALEYRACLLP